MKVYWRDQFRVIEVVVINIMRLKYSMHQGPEGPLTNHPHLFKLFLYSVLRLQLTSNSIVPLLVTCNKRYTERLNCNQVPESSN